MDELTRKLSWSWKPGDEVDALIRREWLVTNGLGGYASGTVAGVLTRRYHGMLVAALPAPLGRVNMLSHLSETLVLPGGRRVPLGGGETPALEVPGAEFLTGFRLEMGLPRWRFECGGFVVEKEIVFPHLQNTVYICYRLVEGEEPVRLEARPSVHFRPHEAPVSDPLHDPYMFRAVGARFEVTASVEMPKLRLMIYGEKGAFTVDGRKIPEVLYRIEKSRGYEASGELWTPGYVQVELCPGGLAALVASTEAWETVEALPPEIALSAERERRRRLVSIAHPEARSGVAAELVLAADQFIILPAGRALESARAHAAGDEARTIIAGYHWFTDWGRDTMISLEGLTMLTGRTAEAEYILRTFAHHIRDGLIPNMFPEHEKGGIYNTADATLWFFHAVDRYVEWSGDRQTLVDFLPGLRAIVEQHLRGTRFGIGVDPKDGLLRQGAEGYQLTWMDAKMGDWVVTPRRGKAVEINALWYNALRLLEEWLRGEGTEKEADEIASHAEAARESFNARFWHEEGGWLYDVVDGENGRDDPACRPNQIFAVSLKYPVLDRARWKPVLDTVEQKLLTPYGLRTLSRDHPDYKPNYHGDLRTRDAAYHQGTVWPWLIGHYLDAWLKAHEDDADEVLRKLEELSGHLSEACIGSVSEVFDAEPPFVARGCIAQAWSVAELLRLLVRAGTLSRRQKAESGSFAMR